MSNSNQIPGGALHPPSPVLFFESVNAFQRTEALKSAIELDLFTAIDEGNHTAQNIAKRCNASERGIRIVCDFLVIAGFLTKKGDEYSLTQDTAFFLSRRSQAYIGTAASFLTGAMPREAFQKLTDAIKKGGTAVGEEGALEPENPLWIDFARAMAPLMAFPAQLIAELLNANSGQPWKILDIAAGHGLFGLTIAKKNPNAKVVALDWKNVLSVAKENAERMELANRFSTIPGNAFEVDYGTGYDLVLLTNFLHHFDVQTCEQLLRKVYAALKPGGRAITFEFVPNEDRISPPVSASFSIIMLAMTPKGEAYTFSEYDGMFRNAGFSKNSFHPLPPTFQQVIISEK